MCCVRGALSVLYVCDALSVMYVYVMLNVYGVLSVMYKCVCTLSVMCLCVFILFFFRVCSSLRWCSPGYVHIIFSPSVFISTLVFSSVLISSLVFTLFFSMECSYYFSAGCVLIFAGVHVPVPKIRSRLSSTFFVLR